LRGDRYTHLGASGEWGMGLALYAGENITVLNIQAREMWGGWYLYWSGK